MQTRTDRVQDIVLGFMSIGVVVTKIMTFFENCVPVDLHFCCGVLPIAAGWLAAC